MGKGQSYILPLQKGFYPVKIEYFRKGEGNLKFVYITPNTKKPQPVPFELMYNKQ